MSHPVYIDYANDTLYFDNLTPRQLSAGLSRPNTGR